MDEVQNIGKVTASKVIEIINDIIGFIDHIIL